MTCYKKVLIATDFSVHSEAAARRARCLAEACGAEIHLVCVIEHFPEDMPCDVVAPEDADPETFIRDHFETRLYDFAERTGLGEAHRRVMLDSGPAKREIVALAEKLGVDLIVVGSYGRRGATAWLGSTADGVAHRTKCDVLMVREDGR